MATSDPMKKVIIHGYTPFAMCVTGYIFVLGLLILIAPGFAPASTAAAFPGWQARAYALALIVPAAVIFYGVYHEIRHPTAPLKGLAWEQRGMRVFVLVAGVLAVSAFAHQFSAPPAVPAMSTVEVWEHAITASLGGLSYAAAAAWRQCYIAAMLRDVRVLEKTARDQAKIVKAARDRADG